MSILIFDKQSNVDLWICGHDPYFGFDFVTSPDLVNWTERSVSEHVSSSGGWYLAHNSEIIVAVGEVGSHLATSVDGITWTSRTAPIRCNTIIWVDDLGLFVAGGSIDTNKGEIMTSPDGINWTERSITSERVASLAWSPELGLLVAGCYSYLSSATDPVILTSPDGINWTGRTSPNNIRYDVNGSCWSPELGLFAMLGALHEPDQLVTSPDGINWTPRVIDATNSYSFGEIAWSPELGVFAVNGIIDSGASHPDIFTSPDGINWTHRTVIVEEGSIGGISYMTWSSEKGVFACTGGLGSYRLIRSYDGITWTAFPFGYLTRDIIYVP